MGSVPVGRRLLRVFHFFTPPSLSRKDSRMGRRCRVFLSDTGPLRLIMRLIAGSLIFSPNGALT